LILGAVLLVAALVAAAWISPTLREIGRLNRAIERQQERYRELLRLHEEFLSVGRREALARKRLRDRLLEGFSIPSVIEGMARESGIQEQVQYLKPGQAPHSDLYREVSVSLKVSGISPQQLVDFLYRIESSERLLRIRSLQIRSASKEPGRLDITLTVFTLVPVDEKKGS
jgi:hypothetical protein